MEASLDSLLILHLSMYAFYARDKYYGVSAK